MVDVCSTWNMETMCDGEHVAWGDWTGLDAINSGEQWDVDNDAKQAEENVDYNVIERQASKNTTTDNSTPMGTPISTTAGAMSPMSNMWGPMCLTLSCPGPDPFDDSPYGTPRA
eukprot:GEMP01124197.1.p1 GENE.GEMP01124197.1~~GEMP01124197.1.p1  ORF type:complete len:114 (+),score=13.61 GEMP01124197.1:91-432(+)